MIHINKKTIFWNIHLFNKRVKDIAVIKSEKMIVENLYTCLQNIALKWYVFELTNMKTNSWNTDQYSSNFQSNFQRQFQNYNFQN